MPDNRLTLAAATDIISSRSKYHWTPRWTGTWKTSDLVPIYAKCSIRPGDTVKMRISAVVRSLQPVFPVMDDAYLSIECYFAKHKHLLSRASMTPNVNDSNHSFSAWLGAQDNLLNMPLPDNDVKLPGFVIWSKTHATDPYKIGGLADCLKMPAPQTSNSSGVYKVNPFKVLAYSSIWNSYFREPSTQNPITYGVTTNPNYGDLVSVYPGDSNIHGETQSASLSKFGLCTVCRDHGYFGSALPWPQRNLTGIELPLGALAPVVTGPVIDDDYIKNNPTLKWGVVGTGLTALSSGQLSWTGSGAQTQIDTGAAGTTVASVMPNNLYADLAQATAATVNQVRYAFAAQRWFEQLARSGNRYDELVYGMTGVRQKDSYDDRPEYLGGKRIPITQNQVNSTAGASNVPGGLGAVGAFTHMADEDYYFTKSFDDFGTLMVVAFVRVKDTFHQGIAREDTVFDKFDMFWSQLANIGEVPIKNKEIFVDGSSNDDGVFGYQEAWADYRLELDGVTGYARPDQSGAASVPFVTYANDFASLPGLKSFLTSTQVSNVDQTLAVQSSQAGYQWFGQFLFDMDVIRAVPTYSIPGYIDHH